MADEEVVHALAVLEAAHRIGATQADQVAATQLLEAQKTRDATGAWRLATRLAGTPAPEAQHFGLKVLQHLAPSRWGELGLDAQSALASHALELFDGACGDNVTFSARSMAALLLAHCVCQAGPGLWAAALSRIQAALAAGPVAVAPAAASVLVLQYVGEEVAGGQAVMEGDRRRAMLAALTESLDAVLPVLRGVMEAHFVEFTRSGNSQHEGVVCEALRCAEQVCEWCPLDRLGHWRMVDAFAVLGQQGSADTRLAAVECLRQLTQRRVREEDGEPGRAVLAQAGRALAGCAAAALGSAEARASLMPGADNEDYGKRLCDSMQLFGSTHLDTLDASERVGFLEIMLAFTRHPSMTLAAFAAPLWGNLLRETRPKPGDARRPPLCPDDCVHAVLVACRERLAELVQCHTRDPRGDTLPEFESEAEWHTFFAQYKNQIVTTIKLCAAVPGLFGPAFADASGAVAAALSQLATTGAAPPDWALDAESMALDAVLGSATAEDLGPGQPTRDACLSMLGDALSLRPPASPAVCVTLAATVHSLARHLRAGSDVVGACFDALLRWALSMLGGGHQPPPSNPPPGWRENFVARSRVVSSVLNIATALPDATLPLLETLAGRTQAMWDGGQLTYGERNILAEAMLSACERSGAAKASELPVMEWVLGPVKAAWSQPSLMASLASTDAFVRTFVDPSVAADGTVTVGGCDARWRFFHELQLIERCLRHVQPDRALDPASASLPATILDGWVEWLLGVALTALTRVHELSAPQGRALLGPAVAALDPSPAERLVLLGQQPGQVAQFVGRGLGQPETGGSVGGATVPALRNWLRGVREGVYQLVTEVVEHVPATFASSKVAEQLVAMMLGAVGDLEERHLRLLLRHVALPVMRRCPRPLRPRWLGPMLGGFLPGMERRVRDMWARLMPYLDGEAAAVAKEGAEAATDEVVRERMVRDLTKDYAGTLQAVAGAGLVPSDPLQHSPTVLEFLAHEGGGAFAAHARSSMLLLTLPDVDGATRALACCRAIVAFVMRERRPGELADVAAGDVLRSCIEALTMPSNQTCHGEIVSLVRDILCVVGQYSQRHTDVLASIPQFGPEGARQIMKELGALTKENDQKALIKRALGSLGKERMRAMASGPASVRVSPGVVRPRVPRVPDADDHAAEMAAAEVFSVLFD